MTPKRTRPQRNRPQRTRPQRTRPRRTTSVSLSPDEWPRVARWLQYWKNEWWKDDRSIPGLFIDQDAMKGIRQLIRKARLTDRKEELTLRLNHDEMEGLRSQMSFWECAMDELAPRFRENAPGSGCFAEIRLQIENALDEASQPPAREIPTLTCTVCGEPANSDATARVGLTPAGRIYAEATHRECERRPGGSLPERRGPAELQK